MRDAILFIIEAPAWIVSTVSIMAYGFAMFGGTIWIGFVAGEMTERRARGPFFVRRTLAICIGIIVALYVGAVFMTAQRQIAFYFLQQGD